MGATKRIMPRAGSTDRQLLEHFVRDHDPGAFQRLVSRHGSAVHRVCRDVLKDWHEAEDAFQATFLVLVRKAPEIRDPEALGGWLRGVAFHPSGREGPRQAHLGKKARRGGLHGGSGTKKPKRSVRI